MQEKKDLQDWQFAELVRTLNRSNEVLSDPTVRKQYDLSLLGVHEFDKYPQQKTVAVVVSVESTRTNIKLAEMLIIGGLVSKDEIDQLTKGGSVSDKQIIDHVIEKQFATFEEIGAVMLAQTLIGKERLTISQFQVAMKEMRNNSIRFVDTLIAEGWMSVEDLPSSL